MQAEAKTGTVPDSNVTEIAPGIFGIGAMIEAERCRTWIPRQVFGWVPSQCYALRDGEQMVLLDGGLPIVRDAVRDGLASVAPGARERRFMMTRRELDTILNLPWIVHDFQFSSVHCGGDLSPIDFFERIDEASADAQINSLTEAPFSFLRPGETYEVGKLRVEMLRASLIVLPTFWFYESTTRTLFSSDCWGFLSQPTPDGARVVRPSDEEVSAERIRAFLGVKFEWLRGIDNAPLARDLEQVFAERPIDRICPNLGCVIEGRAAVDRVLEQTVKALADMAREPWRSALAGWDMGIGEAQSDRGVTARR